MSKSLLEQLPSVVAAGKRQASQMLEQLEGRNRFTLQTRELVIQSKDSAAYDLLHTSRSTEHGESPNRLIYGDNLLAMALHRAFRAWSGLVTSVSVTVSHSPPVCSSRWAYSCSRENSQLRGASLGGFAAA